MSGEDVEGPQKDLPHSACAPLGQSATPRTALIWLTDQCRQRLGADFFSHRVFESAASGGALVVIPDVRYQGDVDETRKRGGIVIKITRPGGTSHPFESHIDCIVADVDILNDGRPEDLRDKVVAAVAKFLQSCPITGSSR
jgi:hypothetical protein